MGLSKTGTVRRVSPLHALFGAAVLGLLVMPIAFAGAKSPEAQSSASAKAQIKSLKRRVAALERRTTPPSPTIPTTLPPSGPAGGDLAGSFPSPQIGPDAVGAPEIAGGAVKGGELGRVISLRSDPAPIGPGERGGVSATCPDGAHLLSGGFEWENFDGVGMRIVNSGSVVPDGVNPALDPNNNPVWGVVGRVDAGGTANTLRAKVLCLLP
jgi:hypothetical protein